jgi:hypothetical protein
MPDKFYTPKGRVSFPRLDRPTYTATLEDVQRQIRAAMTVPDWMLEPKEVRPQDMAIWRAILAGEERFWRLQYRSDLALYRHIVLVNPEHFLRLCKTADRARYASPPCGGRPAVYRFVLFTHPFTGGRAVYSEPVD